MKKLYTLLFALVATTQFIFADAQFFLRINNTGKYQVFLNNESISSRKNIFRFFDILPGNYQLRIVQRNGIQQQVVYQGNLNFQSGFRYVAELAPNLGLQKIAQIPYTENMWFIDQLNVNLPNNGNANNGWGNLPNNCNVPNNNGWNNLPANCATPNNNWNQLPPNHPNFNNNNNSWNPNLNANLCMDNATFQSLINAVKNTPFDDNRIQIMETALINFSVQTNQVKQLLQHITFESNKLKLAKFCYNKTVDRQNYFNIYTVFTFSSSVQELNKYIASL